jgi:hypothetical protein
MPNDRRCIHGGNCRGPSMCRQKKSTIPSPLEGEGRGEGSRRNAIQRENAQPRETNPAPPAPPATWRHPASSQRDPTARLAGLRGASCTQPPSDAAPGPQAAPKSPGRNAMQREPTARPAGAEPPARFPPHPHRQPPPNPKTRRGPPRARRQTKPAGRNAVQPENHANARQGFGLPGLPILSPHGGAPDWSMQR